MVYGDENIDECSGRGQFNTDPELPQESLVIFDSMFKSSFQAAVICDKVKRGNKVLKAHLGCWQGNLVDNL